MENLKNLVTKITEKSEELKGNMETAVNGNKGRGNKSAAIRARKNTLELTKLMKEFRKESTGI